MREMGRSEKGPSTERGKTPGRQENPHQHFPKEKTEARESKPVSIHYPSGHQDAFDVRTLFLDARGMLTSQQKPGPDERHWFKKIVQPQQKVNRERSIPNVVDTERLMQKFHSEKSRKDDEPRSIIAKVPNPVGAFDMGISEKSAGYILLGEPRLKSDGRTHIEIEDVAVKREHRGNPTIIKSLMDRMLTFRVDDQPIVFDTGAVDRTYKMLTHPRIGGLLEEQGYTVVDHNTMQVVDGEKFHDISLVPITHD